MIAHHPSEEHLLAFASGGMPQGAAMVIAGHLNYCPDCRRLTREAEMVGGSLLEAVPAAPMSINPEELDLNGTAATPMPGPDRHALDPRPDVPFPLRPFIGQHLSAIRWRTFWPGMQTVRIRCPEDKADISLLRLGPGTGMPIHSHGGDEMTLVLQGSYSDETGRYGVGDVALADSALSHRPVADPGAHCICLTVIDGDLKFASRLARLANLILPR